VHKDVAVKSDSFGPCANLLDKSSVAQCLDRSLKGRLLIPLE
jgi:hypothetical protein